MGPGDREDLGLLLRALRPAAVALRQLAAELRPHRAGLLPGGVPGLGRGALDSRAAAVFVHADGVLAGHVPPGNPADEAGKAAQSVSADRAALPPAGESLDAGRDVARAEPQSADRPGAEQGGSAQGCATAARGRRGSPGGLHLGPLEPRDVRRHERPAAGGPGNGGIADGRDRPRHANGGEFPSARGASHALSAHVEQRGAAAAHGIRS